MAELTRAQPAESPAGLRLPRVVAERSTLPNGLTIIVHEDRSSPVASVQAWVETGSIHEDRHLGAGMSHMLEHMLFKGTDTRSTSSFAQTVQDAGGYINAYTSFDRTVYWIDIPAKGVPVALELLSDAVLHSTLPSDEYVKEQEVIRREFAMGEDDPDRVAGMMLFATAYAEHPYRHPVIGHLDVFNSLTREDVMSYYKARYVPNNMFFVVAGDVDAGEVRTQLEQQFCGARRRSLEPIYIPPEPVQLGQRERHTEFLTELTRVHLAWHVPALAHPDVPALDLISVMFGGGRSSRFYKHLRERGLVHSVDAWLYTSSQPGLFGVDALLDPANRKVVETEVLRMVAELRDVEVPAAELGKVKKIALSHQIQQLTTMRGKASDLGSNWLLTRSLDFSPNYLNAIQDVTADDIRRVAAEYFAEQNLTITSLNPRGKTTEPLAQTTAAVAGEIKKSELSNGLRLLVREDSRLPLVAVVATFKAGLLAETVENNGVTRLLSKVLLKGTTNRTAEQIADELESVGGTISSDAGNNSLSIAIRVLRSELPLAIEMLGDVLRHANLPDHAVAREKEVQLASLKAEDEEMTSVARRLLRQHLFPAHPYGRRLLGTPESVAQLTREDLLEFRDRHIVARNCVVAVFGDARPLDVAELVKTHLGGMIPGEATLREPVQPAELPGPTEVEELKDKAQAILMVGYRGADMFSADRAALDLIDEASSDLGSRFFVRIREELGLAYFVGSSQMMGLVPGAFIFYLGTDPAKVTAVKAELLDEIHDLSVNGLRADELARAKEKLLGQQEIRNQSNDAFAYTAALDELYGLGATYYRDLRRQVQAVTLEDVQRVARQYFGSRPRVIAVVRPGHDRE